MLGLEKSSPEIFLRAAQIAQQPAAYCMFVGEASAERMHAAAAGMQVCPHPLLIDDALRGDTFRFVRIVVPAESAGTDWRGALRYPVLPVQVSGAQEKVVYAIASRRARVLIANAQFPFQPLGREGDPLVTDVYLLRDDRAARTGFLSNEGQSEPIVAGDLDAESVLSGSSEGLVVALPAGRSVEELHMEEAQHGHNSKLVPDPGLLENFDTPPPAAPWLARAVVDTALDPAELAILNEITKARIERSLAKYAGTEPLSDGARLGSRHIQSNDNARAVAELARDLSASGRLEVTLHPFTHEGRELFNVVAHLQGDDASVVLVTAHLDSTAASSLPYDPVRDPAPGADDDGSGVAAVLTAAETLLKLASARRPRRASGSCCSMPRSTGWPAARPMRWVRLRSARASPPSSRWTWSGSTGSRRDPGRCTPASCRQRMCKASRELAELLEKLRPGRFSELTAAQIYLSLRPLPSERDPAEGRSDHSPFHEHGYAACVTSEDFFAGPHPELAGSRTQSRLSQEDRHLRGSGIRGRHRPGCRCRRLGDRSQLEHVAAKLMHNGATNSVCSPPPCGEGLGVGVRVGKPRHVQT